MVFFADFGKTVTDLFKKKDYELQRSIKVKCASANTEWTAESSFPITGAGGSTTKAKYKQKDKKFGTMTIEVPNNKAMKIDYEAPNFVDGFKMNLISEYPKASLKGKYEEGETAAKFCVNTTMTNTSQLGLEAEVAREIQGIWVGGEVKYHTADGLKGYLAGMHYKTDDTQLSLKTNTDDLHVQLHKKYSSSGEVAANYDLNLKDYTPSVSVGGKWKLDEKCTAQGFVKSDGNTYLLYKHKLTDRCTAHLGTSFNMNGVNDNVNVHYKFEFEA